MPTRRDFHAGLTMCLGLLMKLTVVIPGVAYFIDPLRKQAKAGSFRPLTRLSQLPIGVPQSFPIIEERRDAWVRYPKEPVGSVWLVRQPEGTGEKVVAFTAECPHLGCAINLAADAKSFLCPCHTSSFAFTGAPTNKVPPRGMDRLDVEYSTDADPEIRVKFERYQTQSEEKKPLV